MGKIIITGFKESGGEKLGGILKSALSHEKGVNMELKQYNTDVFKSDVSNTSYIFFYCPAEFCITKAGLNLAINVAVMQTTLDDWINANNEILHFYNRNTDRCLLINTYALNNKNCINILSEGVQNMFGLRLMDLNLDPMMKVNNLSAIERFLVAQFIEDNTNQANSLFNELESVAHIYQRESKCIAPTFDVRQQYQYLFDSVNRDKKLIDKQQQLLEESQHRLNKSLANTAGLKLENKAQAKEIANIMVQLSRLQVELEDQQTNQKNIVKSSAANIEELQAKILLLNTENIELNNDNAELIDENRLMLTQLHRVQEEFEIYFDKVQKLTIESATPNKVVILNQTNDLTLSKRKKKLRKLKTKPVLFFSDAVKNIFLNKRKAIN